MREAQLLHSPAAEPAVIRVRLRHSGGFLWPRACHWQWHTRLPVSLCNLNGFPVYCSTSKLREPETRADRPAEKSIDLVNISMNFTFKLLAKHCCIGFQSRSSLAVILVSLQLILPQQPFEVRLFSLSETGFANCWSTC